MIYDLLQQNKQIQKVNKRVLLQSAVQQSPPDVRPLSCWL